MCSSLLRTMVALIVVLLTVSTALVKCIVCEAHCNMPYQDAPMFLRCAVGGSPVPCGAIVRPGTSVAFQCADFYVLETGAPSAIECTPNGSWNSSAPKCVPECGKVSSAVPLIVRGTPVTPGLFPWQVAMYHKNGDDYEFFCGGSLISARSVLTAAHCAWQVPAADLKVALGKKYREEKVSGEEAHQMIQVAEVEMLDSYQDVSGNFNGDLAMLVLQRSAVFSAKVAPVCIDWDLQFIDDMLTENNTGVVLGWGLTENDTFSPELRALRVPVMSDDSCIKQQQRDFRKYVTYTTFCAGFTNGTGVCNGDSGGGLSFLEPKSDTWYLQGLVSVSPRRRGTPYCDPTFFSVFTKVPMFTTWLRKMLQREEELMAMERLIPGAVKPISHNIIASMTTV